MKIPPPVIINPPSPAKSAIVWMHGLGADAHDFEGIVPMLPVEEHSTRMVFPNAPKRPVTINGGFVMPAWYDISDIEFRNADKAGIAESTERIHGILDGLIAQGIPSERIVLAGFSQGGAMSLHAGLRYRQPLAGIMALSCYVLDRDNHSSEISNANLNTPIWMANGTQDAVVSYELGKSGADFLRNNGHKMTFMSYPMGHELCEAEVNALALWLDSIFTITAQ